MLVLHGLREEGRPSLPALGMQVLPNQLANGLERRVEHGRRRPRRAPRPGPGVGVMTDGEEIAARAVVVATDPVGASRLLGLGSPAMRGQATWWFAAPVAPTTLKTAFVNPLGPAGGPLSTRGRLQRGAALRPAGAVLVAACSVPLPGTDAGTESESDVRRHLGQVSSTPTPRRGGWWPATPARRRGHGPAPAAQRA